MGLTGLSSRDKENDVLPNKMIVGFPNNYRDVFIFRKKHFEIVIMVKQISHYI